MTPNDRRLADGLSNVTVGQVRGWITRTLGWLVTLCVLTLVLSGCSQELSARVAYGVHAPRYWTWMAGKVEVSKESPAAALPIHKECYRLSVDKGRVAQAAAGTPLADYGTMLADYEACMARHAYTVVIGDTIAITLDGAPR